MDLKLVKLLFPRNNKNRGIAGGVGSRTGNSMGFVEIFLESLDMFFDLLSKST